MRNVLKNWKSLLFNITELLLIMLSGYLLKLKIEDVAIVLALFCGVRIFTKSAIHYKSWKKCLCWSLLLITSLLILVKINIFIAGIMSAYAAIIVSRKADIKDCFMYRNNPKERKYRELEYYIAKNKKSKELKKFEEILIDLNKTYMERYKVNLYEVYKLYFLEGKSFGEIIKITDIYDNHGVTKALDIIFFSFNTYIVTIGEKEQLNLEELTYNS